MKKFFFTLVLLCSLFALSNESSAQSNWEVGMRFGNYISLDATIPIGAAPRFHPNIYFDRFGIGGYFDWMFALSDGPAGLKFYPGVGPEFWFGNRFDFRVVGNFGVEYSFGFPLTIGFDWRPGFEFTNDFDFVTRNWGFTARFRFGEGTSFKKVE
jgi:hypothetical protein